MGSKGLLSEHSFKPVGEGWYPILEALEATLAGILKSSAHPDEFQIDCIKEKFGRLHVYWSGWGLEEEVLYRITGAIDLVQQLSVRICEACGSAEGTENRKATAGVGAVRTLTLCAKCHKIRDETGTLTFGGHTV